MPILIDGAPNVSIHKSFWDALTKNSDSLALSQLWLCAIDKQTINAISSRLQEELNLFEEGAWNTRNELLEIFYTITHPSNWTGISSNDAKASDIYLWVTGVSFVADGLNTSRIGVSQTGATKGLIGDTRLDLNATNITFLESNVSFVDGFLRPWAALVGHKSLKDENLRCNIELFALEKWEIDKPFKVRKSMLFRNAIPINIDQEEYNYTGDKLIERQVQFAFDRYESRVYPDTTNKDLAHNMVITDILEYPKNQSDPNTKGKTLLQTVKGIMDVATTTASQVKGAVDTVTSSVAQGLQAVGMDKQASKVTNLNQRFQSNIISPFTKIVGTGQNVVARGENIASAVGNITGANKVTADQVKDQLRAREINTTVQPQSTTADGAIKQISDNAQKTKEINATARPQSTTADGATQQILDNAQKVSKLNSVADKGQDMTLIEPADIETIA